MDKSKEVEGVKKKRLSRKELRSEMLKYKAMVLKHTYMKVTPPKLETMIPSHKHVFKATVFDTTSVVYCNWSCLCGLTVCQTVGQLVPPAQYPSNPNLLEWEEFEGKYADQVFEKDMVSGIKK